ARRVDGKLLFGLTSPLMTTSSGAKMGKTANGAVWLNKDRLSSYDYWQFWRNTEDADVGKFLRLFTELPISEIERLEKLKDREINEAKKILADEATKLCHGESAAIEARETARKTFEEGKAGGSLPTFDVQKDKLEAGISLIDLLILAKLCKSKGESRRMMKQGGIRLNDEQIKDEAYSVTLENITDNGTIKLSSGKKRHALIKTV
ncbi:MAG: tyrosine--tRNA ligase, partial [Alphaproteobacteria bacterium]|nr:tyrosine--tRNA ligase [Alphaproteobacteria bacterium]